MLPSLENEFQAPASVVENLKIPILGSKMKVVVNFIYQEKNAKPMKKELAQSDIPVSRKIQKTTRNVTFLKNSVFGWFFGFFSLLVCPIELILSSLVLYFLTRT